MTQSDAGHVLSVRGFGAAFGTRVVLAELDFNVPRLGVTALLGPSGSGKSTLLRSLAGMNAANPRYQEWGEVQYAGAPCADAHRPRLVQQNTKLMRATALDALAEHVRGADAFSPAELRTWAEDYGLRMGFPEMGQALDRPTMDLPTVHQRAVAILAQASTEPALLMVDEPTADLSDYESYLLLDLLRNVGKETAVLVVLHNQRHAQMVAEHMVLLAGGRIQEARAMEAFVSAPLSEAGEQFLRTGSCAVPSPDADPATLAQEVSLPPPLPEAAQRAVEAAAAQPATAAAGPHGFAWLAPGKLAGTPLPGVVQDIGHDLDALRRAGVTALITLTERDLPQDALAAKGLTNLHLPIYDREPPTVAQIQMLLRRMEILIDKGHVLAVHCLAGLGRTGTVLAAWLVREGLTAQEALRRVRLVNPDYVQTAEQEAFLGLYEDAILRKIV